MHNLAKVNGFRVTEGLKVEIRRVWRGGEVAKLAIFISFSEISLKLSGLAQKLLYTKLIYIKFRTKMVLGIILLK